MSTLETGESYPSAVVVHGDQVCPIVTDENNRTFVASSRVGLGRVLFYGHEIHIGGALAEAGDSAALLRNALGWLTG